MIDKYNYFKLPVGISKDVEVQCRKIKKQFFFFFKSKTTGLCCWFCLDSLESEKEITRNVLKSLETVESGFMSSFILKGVGFKASTEKGFLKLKVGKPESIDYKIPDNVHIYVTGSTVKGWSPDLSLIKNFFHKVIKKTPARKGSLVLNGIN